MVENILITGGAGYIGSLLTQKLVKEGHNVTIFDNLLYGENSLKRLNVLLTENISLSQVLKDRNLNRYPRTSSKQYRFIEGDITDKETVINLISNGKFSYVIHFAELVSHFLCETNPARTRTVNYGGTQNVIAGILNSSNPPRFIYNSSSSVYHISTDNIPFTEESPLPEFNNLDEYCKNKLLCESHILDKSQHGERFQFLIFRPATVGGLSPRMRVDLLPNHFTYAAMTTGRVLLANSGDNRAVIDINDLVDVYSLIITSDTWHNGIFNVGSVNLSKLEYASQVCRLTSLDTSPVEQNTQMGDMRNLTISSELLSKMYKISPTGGIEKIVLPLIEILRSDPNTFSSTSGNPLLVDREFINTLPQKFMELLK